MSDIDASTTTGSSLFNTQQDMAPGAVKQRHLVPSPTQPGDLYYGKDGNSFTNLSAGTSGQVLTISNGVPSWQNATTLPLTTKGDLITYSTVPVRLPVGADGTHLVADSSQTTGLSWVQTDVSVRAFNSGAVAIGNSSSTPVAWDSETFDTAAMHSNSVNTSRLTITVAGKYMIGAFLTLADGAGARLFSITKNGATLTQDAEQSSTRGRATPIVFDLAAVSDYYEIVIFQDSGGSLNLNTGSFFWAYKAF